MVYCVKSSKYRSNYMVDEHILLANDMYSYTFSIYSGITWRNIL